MKGGAAQERRRARDGRAGRVRRLPAGRARSTAARTAHELPGIGILDLHTVHPAQPRSASSATSSWRWNGGHARSGSRTTAGARSSARARKPLAKVVTGFGNNGADGVEGAVSGNVFGTYLHGSLLPKNSAFADHLISLALGGAPLSPLDDLPWKDGARRSCAAGDAEKYHAIWRSITWKLQHLKPPTYRATTASRPSARPWRRSPACGSSPATRTARSSLVEYDPESGASSQRSNRRWMKRAIRSEVGPWSVRSRQRRSSRRALSLFCACGSWLAGRYRSRRRPHHLAR